MFIIPTVDVEGVHGSRPFEQMILGKVGDRELWGVTRLADVFKQYGVSATFFVDCYESSLWGEGPMEQVCHALADRGQDVQLHTHPSWRDDPRDADWLREYKRARSYLSQERDFMAKLDYQAQVEVLEAGVEMLNRWLCKRPVAHRSGGYSINQDTIRALGAVGIPVDSSMNAAHRNSKLVWSRNSVEYRDGILELPVTLLNYVYRPVASDWAPLGRGKLKKTDLNVCSALDLKAYVERGARSGLRMMNLFMHSYSLLDYDPLLRPTYSKISPDRGRLRTLERFLEWATGDERVRFASASDAWEGFQRSPDDWLGPDSTPTIYSPGTLLRHAARNARRQISKAWSETAGRGSPPAGGKEAA